MHKIFCHFVQISEKLLRNSFFAKQHILSLRKSTDDVFNCSMPNLEFLNCMACYNLKDTGLARLIESSQLLEILILTECMQISNSLVEAAIISTKKRRNNIILNSLVSRTSVPLQEVANASPYLLLLSYIGILLLYY